MEFEPLISEIQERLKLTFTAMNNFTKDGHSIHEYKPMLVQALSQMFETSDVDKFLIKIELHLLRLWNNEFVYYNIVQNQ